MAKVYRRFASLMTLLLLRPFAMLATGMRAFFKADLRLRRDGRGLKVVLAAPPRSREQRRLDDAASKAQAELLPIRRSLTRLLDEPPGNRATMRHLVLVERALERKGLEVLHKLPYEGLQSALAQLESLVVNWSDEGLAALRSKMAVTLIERESRDDDEAPVRPLESLFIGPAAPAPFTSPKTANAANAKDAADTSADAVLRAAYGGIALPDPAFGQTEVLAPQAQGEPRPGP